MEWKPNTLASLTLEASDLRYHRLVGVVAIASGAKNG